MSEADIAKVILGLVGPVSRVVTVILILSLVGLGIYFRRYLEQKATQLATREDFNALQAQVGQSTRLVEGIKSELANNDWVKRELHNLRIRKVEELVTLALNCFHDIDAFRNAAIERRHYQEERHHDRMRAVALVYLPELEPLAAAYWLALVTHYEQVGATGLNAIANGIGVWDQFHENSNYRDILTSFDALKKGVAELLQATANGTVFRQVPAAQ